MAALGDGNSHGRVYLVDQGRLWNHFSPHC